MAKDDAKQTLTPKLRFSEFRKARPWTVTKVGDVLEETARPIEMEDDKTYSLVTVKRRYGGVVAREQLPGRAIKVKSQFIVNKDDFLISKRQIVHDACGVVPAELDGSIVSNEYSVLRARKDADIRFFDYFAQQPTVSASFLTSSVGIVIEKMLFKLKTWLRYEFPFPPLAEQQKIADCLTSLDELIAAQGRKVETLKAHKKALMQHLFPREGETLPRLRFPEFHDAPAWEECTLGDCFSHIRNGFVGTATPFYVADGIPYLQGKNVKKGRIDPTGLVNISKEFHNKQKKSQLQIGDIVVVQSGHVGECALIDEAYAGANCHALIIMTPMDGNHSDFFVHCLGADYGLRLIAEITTGNTIRHILASDMKALVVHRPQPAEQQRIAACLTALDAQLAAEVEKLAALKTHKKGLMQQLFPSPEG